MIRREEKGEHLHVGHRSRMRGKLVSHGTHIFESYELLEILLFSSIRSGDTNPQAKRLMARFGGISELLSATREELTAILGIGQRSAELILCLGEINRLLAARAGSHGRIIDNMQTAGEIAVKHFSGLKTHKVSAIFIDNSMRLIGIYDMFDRDFSSAKVTSDRLVDLCIRLNAAAVIVMHNHPYGPLFASEGDLESDKLMNRALDAIGVLGLEHIVVSGDNYIGITGRRSLAFLQDPYIKSFLEKRARLHAFSALVQSAKEKRPLFDRDVEISAALSSLFAFTHKAEDAAALTDGLIFRYGCISRVLSLSVEEMLNNSDMTLADAVMLRTVGALLSRSVTEKFNFNVRHTEGEIVDYLKALFLGEGTEKLYAIFRKDGKITRPHLLSEGSVNSVCVTPRMLIDRATMADAHEIILAHNHPGGVARASMDDRTMTAILNNTLTEVGIRIILHYVVADGEYDVIRSESPENR